MAQHQNGRNYILKSFIESLNIPSFTHVVSTVRYYDYYIIDIELQSHNLDHFLVQQILQVSQGNQILTQAGQQILTQAGQQIVLQTMPAQGQTLQQGQALQIQGQGGQLQQVSITPSPCGEGWRDSYLILVNYNKLHGIF